MLENIVLIVCSTFTICFVVGSICEAVQAFAQRPSDAETTETKPGSDA